MHDAVTARKAGLAATAIMTDRFTATAEAMARATGMPAFPFAVIPHPISNNDDTVLRAKAREAVAQCVAILTEH